MKRVKLPSRTASVKKSTGVKSTVKKSTGVKKSAGVKSTVCVKKSAGLKSTVKKSVGVKSTNAKMVKPLPKSTIKANKRSGTSTTKVSHPKTKEKDSARYARDDKEDDSDQGRIYEIEEILAISRCDSQAVCLVSWVGSGEATWELVSDMPAESVTKFQELQMHHLTKCKKGPVKECLDMDDEGTDEKLFQVSWVQCDHQTWEPQRSIPQHLINTYYRKTSGRETDECNKSDDENGDSNASEKFEVDEILATGELGNEKRVFVSWVGFADATWELETDMPAGSVKKFKDTILFHSTKCKKGRVKKCLDMDEGSNTALFQVSWSGCNHLTWELEATLPKSLVATCRSERRDIEEQDGDIRSAISSEFGRNICEDTCASELGIPQRHPFVTQAVLPISTGSYLLPIPQFPENMGCDTLSKTDVRKTSMRASSVTQRVAKKVIASKTGSSNLMDHVHIDMDICPVCNQSEGLGSACVKCLRPMHHFCATDVCRRLNMKDSVGEVILEFANDVCYCSSQCFYGSQTVASGSNVLADVQTCPVCNGSEDLGRSCERCKRRMHHFCATDVCQGMKLKGDNGQYMMEFANDSCYCSSQCFYGSNSAVRQRRSKHVSLAHLLDSDEDPIVHCVTKKVTPCRVNSGVAVGKIKPASDYEESGVAHNKAALSRVNSGGALGKRKRIMTASDYEESDESKSDDNLEDEDEEDDGSNARSNTVTKATNKPTAVAATKKQTTPSKKRMILPKTNLAGTSIEATSKAKPQARQKVSSEDPLMYKMVAFSADQEDWMDSTIYPQKLTKNGEPRRNKHGKVIPPKISAFSEAKGYYLQGRTHPPKNPKHPFIYEVRWTNTKFSDKKIHYIRLTAAQIERGINNFKRIHGNRLSEAVFASMCKAPVSGRMQIHDNLDDYEILDPTSHKMIMDQVYPDNLEVVEGLRELRFDTTTEILAPPDLFTQDDGTTDTKIIKSRESVFKTASSSFFAYLPVSFWEHAVKNTNEKARQVAEAKRNEFKSKLVTLDEMIKFLGILFYMTVVDKGEFSNYWGVQIEDQIFEVEDVRPGLEKIMSRKRFMYIRKYLCFNSKVDRVMLSEDTAARVRPLMSMLQRTSRLYVHLGRNISLDESSIACRSKYARRLIMYNAKKPTGKYHFKIYAVCCASSWLLVNFKLHCESTKEARLDVSFDEDLRRALDNPNLQVTRSLVYELIEPFLRSKRIVNTDNYYTSVKLLSGLRECGLYGRGTVKAESQHFPKAHVFGKKSKELRGSMMQGVCKAERMVAASWVDGTVVNVISNADSSALGTVDRMVDKKISSYVAPSCIGEYNKYMQGVDRLDQLRAKYSIADGHSMQKWHNKLALAFIDMARVNGYVTKQMSSFKRNSRNPHREFMAELASEMISGKWRDSADEGGLVIAALTEAGEGGRRSIPGTPRTPTIQASTCTFVMSSTLFPDASRGKRGCKVCQFELRTQTMKTNYCEQHQVCLCTEEYPIHPALAGLVCPHADWNCWRKFHEYYLPRGVYNSAGHVMRSSTMWQAVRALNLKPYDLPRVSFDLCTRQDSRRALNMDDNSALSSDPRSEITSTPVMDSDIATSPNPRQDTRSELDIDNIFQSTQPLATQLRERHSGPGPSEPRLEDFTAPAFSSSYSDVATPPNPPSLVVSPFDGTQSNDGSAMSNYGTPFDGTQTNDESSMSNYEMESAFSSISEKSRSLDFPP